MFDLLAAAWQADVTRVFTFMMSRELSQRTYPQIGVTEQHHSVSHHTNNPDKMAKMVIVNTYYVQFFAKIPREAASHRRRRRIASGSFPDCVRSRHGRFQFACFRSVADCAGRRRCRRRASSRSGSRADACGLPVVHRGGSVRRAPDGAIRRRQKERSMACFRTFAVGVILLATPPDRAGSRPVPTAPAAAIANDGTTPLHWPSAPTILQRCSVFCVRAPIPVPPIATASRRCRWPRRTAMPKSWRCCLKAGADPKAMLPGGQTLLMTAARTGNPEAVKLLLDRGADPNARENTNGETALMWAAAENHPEVVRVLAAAERI